MVLLKLEYILKSMRQNTRVHNNLPFIELARMPESTLIAEPLAMWIISHTAVNNPSALSVMLLGTLDSVAVISETNFEIAK